MPPDETDSGQYAARIRAFFYQVASFAGVALVYIAIAKLSLALASIHPSATPIWPPTGFALAAMLLLGYQIFPAIFVGALITNLTTAGSIFTSLAIAAGNTLESVIGYYLLHLWSNGSRTFDTPIGVIRFALICLIPSTMTSATLGVGSLSLAGYADVSAFRSIWTTWWTGDLAAALVITPALVLWGRTLRGPIDRQDLIQSILVYAAAVAVGLVAFSPLLAGFPSRTPSAFIAVLPLLWAALRRNQRDTATTALLLSAFAVWGAMDRMGPFFRDNLNESFLLLLAFMISISLPTLALSADVAVRKQHEEHLKFVTQELSHRSKNLFLVVQSIASQVARQADSVDGFLLRFGTRLRAFAETHDLLMQKSWRGATMRDLVQMHLAPFHNASEAPIFAEGPELTLQPKAAEQIGLALHELGTNAVKHGALSAPSGWVRIRWEMETDESRKRHLRFVWKESDGPPVAAPQRRGFGDYVISRMVPASLGGSASVDFEPDGLRWELTVPAETALA